jgi:hypothetical protein
VADEPVDIYTLLHKAIWTALQAHAPLTDLVAVRNFVDMTADDFDEFPPNTPEVGTVTISMLKNLPRRAYS